MTGGQPLTVYLPAQELERLETRADRLTEDASVAFANQDYTPEDIMRLLVEALAVQRDMLASLRRLREALRYL